MVKAVVVRAAGAEPEVCEVEPRSLGPADVRVRVRAAGVCHSDLSMIDGVIVPRLPLVLGHEASGVVVEVGDGVRGVRLDDPVILNWAPACRRCWFCLRGEPWLCKRVEGVLSVPGGRLADGTEVEVGLGVGAFAEEVVVPEDAVVPLPDGVPLDLGALLGCAVLTGTGAVRNTARVASGESVVVIGLGGVGLSAVAGAALAGAVPIIAVDQSPDKEVVARSVGATEFLVAGPRLAKQVRELTGGRGADYAFECVGRAATIRQAWQVTRRGGQAVVVGIGGTDDEVTFSAMELYHFARGVMVSVFGSSDPARDIPVLARHVANGRLDLERLVTHRTDLAGVPEAFDRMRRGDGARSLVELGDPK